MRLPTLPTTFICVILFLMCFLPYSELSAAGRFSTKKEESVEAKLKDHIEQLQKLNGQTTKDELISVLTAFKAFCEETTGKKISFISMYEDLEKSLANANLKIDKKQLKQFFTDLEESTKVKNKRYSHSKSKSKDEEIVIPGNIIIGGVLIACAPLVMAISVACPPAAPLCTGTAAFLGSTGAAMILAGLATIGDENEKKKKK